MCAPMSPDDDLPKLPAIAIARDALDKAEADRAELYSGIINGGTLPGFALEHAGSRIVRATAEVTRRRIELDQAYIAQARGTRACVDYPCPSEVWGAVKARLGHNRSMRQVEDRATGSMASRGIPTGFPAVADSTVHA